MKKQAKSSTIPNWAPWPENWCGSWLHETKKIEVGILVVKFSDDDKLHLGMVHPTTGVMTAGGFAFEAGRQNGKRSFKVLPTGLKKHLGDVVPTEGEVYEEDDETP